MSITRTLAFGLAAVLIAGACGGASTAPSASPAATTAATAAAQASATPAAPVKIKASYGNITPANLAPFMAKELGLFEKRGLDVSLDLIDGGNPSAAALVAGQTQIGQFGGTEAMSGVAGGSDMVVVALFVPVTPWQLLARTDYKQPSDLKGKVVGVASTGGSAAIAASVALAKLGLDPQKDVQIQSFGSVANLTKGMIGGAAYAGPGHPPDTVQLLANGFKVVYDLAGEKVPATDNGTIVLRSYAEKNPQVVQSYVDAEIEAIGIAKKDRAKTLPILAKLLRLDMTKDADALAQTYDFYVGRIFPLYPHPIREAFVYTRDDLVKTNPKVKDLDVTKVIDDTYVADAERRGVGK